MTSASTAGGASGETPRCGGAGTCSGVGDGARGRAGSVWPEVEGLVWGGFGVQDWLGVRGSFRSEGLGLGYEDEGLV